MGKDTNAVLRKYYADRDRNFEGARQLRKRVRSRARLVGRTLPRRPNGRQEVDVSSLECG